MDGEHCPADLDGCTSTTCTRNDCASCGAASNPKDRTCYRCGAALEGAPCTRAKAILAKIDEGLSKLRSGGRWDDLYSVVDPLTRREAEG